MINKIAPLLRSHVATILKTLLAIAIIGAVFYWYEYRPMRIRQYCVKETIENAKNSRGTTASTIRLIYWKCITEKGI